MPIIEIAVLIQVGGWLGLGPTLAMIILTAIAGTWMLRAQGLAVLSRAQTQLQRGTVPLEEVFEGFCLVIAGALLLTPGFVTDAFGGALLLPPCRRWLYRMMGRRFRDGVAVSGMAGGSGGDHGDSVVVEGDFETVTPEDEDTGDRHGAKDDAGGNQPSRSQPSRSDPTQPMPPPRGDWGSRS